MRARQYDTVIGRFTQEDTYLGDGRNLYVYVGNNPLKYVDPSGHDRELGDTKLAEFTAVKKSIELDNVNLPLYNLGYLSVGAELGMQGLNFSAMASAFKTGIEGEIFDVTVGVELALFSVGGELKTDWKDELKISYGGGLFGASIYMEKEKSTIKKVVVDKKITREVTLPKKGRGLNEQN